MNSNETRIATKIQKTLALLAPNMSPADAEVTQLDHGVSICFRFDPTSEQEVENIPMIRGLKKYSKASVEIDQKAGSCQITIPDAGLRGLEISINRLNKAHASIR